MATQFHTRPSSGASSQRRVKVLVLHHLGGNAHAMRKRMQPLIDALPHAEQFDFFFADAPYMMPGIGKVAIVNQPGGTVNFGGPAHHPDASEEMIHKVRTAEAAIRAMSLSRATETEAWSEARRGGCEKRARCDLEESRQLASQLLDKIEDKDAISTADELLNQGAPNSKQGRWWLIRAKGNSGPWIGEEYALAWLSQILDQHGPFDGCVGFSSGAMMAQLAQSLLSGAVPRSNEPTFTTAHPAFKFSLFFSPFVPYDSRYIGYLRDSGKKSNRMLVVAGLEDKIVNPEMAKTFADYSGADTIAVHAGGHVIPSDRDWSNRLANWLESSVESELDLTLGPSRLARL